MSLDKNKEYRDLFLQEAQEHIQTLNYSMLELEKDPNNKEHINNSFRSAHTLKGMSAAMGYHKIASLCSEIEELLGKLRDDKIKINDKIADTLLKCFDILENMIKDENYTIDLDACLKNLEDSTMQNSSFPISDIDRVNTIRVKMTELDNLVNLVGDLLLSKMKIEQTVSKIPNDEIKHNILHLNRICSELQDQAMKLRLVPLDHIFSKFPRVVRDLAKQQGKKIKFTMNTSGIELDRTILDTITDPILHIIRNTIDHGIETPEERERLQKNATGTMTLNAFRFADKVAIEVSDDGRGIDLEKLKTVAVKKNILKKEELDSITNDNIIDLLGTPGLSTSDVITDISGRGVGFDVVKKHVTSVGGQIRLQTKKNQGTAITLLLPLSLAIIEGLLVGVGNQKFVIPISNVTSVALIRDDDIKSVHGKQMILFRDKVIPLIKISDRMKIVNQNPSKELRSTVVVVEVNGNFYGLEVDTFEHKQETVIMNIPNIKHIRNSFSNATILADGRVSLILDPELIVKELVTN